MRYARPGVCVALVLAVAPACRGGPIAPTQPVNGLSQAELSARW